MCEYVEKTGVPQMVSHVVNVYGVGLPEGKADDC